MRTSADQSSLCLVFIDREDDSRFQWLFVAMPIALAAAFLFALFNPQEQPPVAKNSTVFGCYTSDRAPAITLDARGMHIVQPGFPTIPFHLERHKTGYALTADRPIQAEQRGTSFLYSFYGPGAGTYLDFFHIINGQKYGVIDEADLASFTMLARNGTYLNYTKDEAAACSTSGNVG